MSENGGNWGIREKGAEHTVLQGGMVLGLDSRPRQHR